MPRLSTSDNISNRNLFTLFLLLLAGLNIHSIASLSSLLKTNTNPSTRRNPEEGNNNESPASNAIQKRSSLTCTDYTSVTFPSTWGNPTASQVGCSESPAIRLPNDQAVVVYCPTATTVGAVLFNADLSVNNTFSFSQNPSGAAESQPNARYISNTGAIEFVWSRANTTLGGAQPWIRTYTISSTLTPSGNERMLYGTSATSLSSITGPDASAQGSTANTYQISYVTTQTASGSSQIYGYYQSAITSGSGAYTQIGPSGTGNSYKNPTVSYVSGQVTFVAYVVYSGSIPIQVQATVITNTFVSASYPITSNSSLVHTGVVSTAIGNSDQDIFTVTTATISGKSTLTFQSLNQYLIPLQTEAMLYSSTLAQTSAGVTMVTDASGNPWAAILVAQNNGTNTIANLVFVNTNDMVTKKGPYTLPTSAQFVAGTTSQYWTDLVPSSTKGKFAAFWTEQDSSVRPQKVILFFDTTLLTSPTAASFQQAGAQVSLPIVLGRPVYPLASINVNFQITPAINGYPTGSITNTNSPAGTSATITATQWTFTATTLEGFNNFCLAYVAPYGATNVTVSYTITTKNTAGTTLNTFTGNTVLTAIKNTPIVSVDPNGLFVTQNVAAQLTTSNVTTSAYYTLPANILYQFTPPSGVSILDNGTVTTQASQQDLLNGLVYVDVTTATGLPTIPFTVTADGYTLPGTLKVTSLIPAPTTPAPTTATPTTAAPTTATPTTAAPTTAAPTTAAPTTAAPTTATPTTAAPTTATPTTAAPTTAAPTTVAPTTATPTDTTAPTTAGPTTATPTDTTAPTTAAPTTATPTDTTAPTTAGPTTATPTDTTAPTTAAPTTATPTDTTAPTTAAPTTAGPTTAVPTTATPTDTTAPTTAAPTTATPTDTTAPTTAAPTTATPTDTTAPTTAAPTTATPTDTTAPTTAAPTTATPTDTTAPTTAGPTTATPTDTTAPTTAGPTTATPTDTTAPTTAGPTTATPTDTTAPTTAAPTTAVPATAIPTDTTAPTTAVPTTAIPTDTTAPTTAGPTTAVPTTATPTSQAPTSPAPTTPAPITAAPTSPVPPTLAQYNYRVTLSSLIPVILTPINFFANAPGNPSANTYGFLFAEVTGAIIKVNGQPVTFVTQAAFNTFVNVTLTPEGDGQTIYMFTEACYWDGTTPSYCTVALPVNVQNNIPAPTTPAPTTPTTPTTPTPTTATPTTLAPTTPAPTTATPTTPAPTTVGPTTPAPTNGTGVLPPPNSQDSGAAGFFAQLYALITNNPAISGVIFSILGGGLVIVVGAYWRRWYTQRDELEALLTDTVLKEIYNSIKTYGKLPIEYKTVGVNQASVFTGIVNGVFVPAFRGSSIPKEFRIDNFLTDIIPLLNLALTNNKQNTAQLPLDNDDNHELSADEKLKIVMQLFILEMLKERTVRKRSNRKSSVSLASSTSRTSLQPTPSSSSTLSLKDTITLPGLEKLTLKALRDPRRVEAAAKAVLLSSEGLKPYIDVRNELQQLEIEKGLAMLAQHRASGPLAGAMPPPKYETPPGSVHKAVAGSSSSEGTASDVQVASEHPSRAGSERSEHAPSFVIDPPEDAAVPAGVPATPSAPQSTLLAVSTTTTPKKRREVGPATMRALHLDTADAQAFGDLIEMEQMGGGASTPTPTSTVMLDANAVKPAPTPPAAAEPPITERERRASREIGGLVLALMGLDELRAENPGVVPVVTPPSPKARVTVGPPPVLQRKPAPPPPGPSPVPGRPVASRIRVGNVPGFAGEQTEQRGDGTVQWTVPQGLARFPSNGNESGAGAGAAPPRDAVRPAARPQAAAPRS